MKIALSVITTIFLMTGLSWWAGKPSHYEPTLTLFVSKQFMKDLKKHELEGLSYLVGTNKHGEEIKLPLDFSPSPASNDNSDAGHNTGVINDLKSATRVLFSHSATCNKRSDLESHEPVASCTAGGWYNPLWHGGQNYLHCHCSIPWGNP